MNSQSKANDPRQGSANEIALYRKYRPQKWADVIGQDHVIKPLQGAVASGNIFHAYLFSGTRGTGKTSVARILASQIGCSANDLYEIDAASNRGIDDIRQLKESVNTMPFESPYKVYIVDEVHMLTKEAFNALLKTLEEPPAHVVFILATTELDKLPETVVSRCQTFVFRKPSREVLKKVVSDIAKEEGFALESAAAELIALLGDGSFRDTEGLLQKVLGASIGSSIGGPGNKGGKTAEIITAEQVELMTGAPRTDLVNQFIEAIDESGNSGLENGLRSIRTASQQNLDMKTFLRLVLHKLRMVMLLRFAPEMEAGIKAEVGDKDFAFLKSLAHSDSMDRKEKKGTEEAGAGKIDKNSNDRKSGISSRALLELLYAYDQIGKAFLPELPMELALMKIVGQDK